MKSKRPLVGFASPASGCLYYRAQIPARMLEARGWRTVWTVDLEVGSRGGFAFPAGPGSPACEPDVIVLAGGWASDQAYRHISAARRNGQRIVVDCDDWPQPPPENIFHTADGAANRLRAMRAANALVCSTAFLRDELRRRGLEVQLARNIIDPDDYRRPAAVNRAAEHARELGDELPLAVAYRGMLCGFHDADAAELAGLELPAGAGLVHLGADPRGARLAELVGRPVEERPAVAFYADAAGEKLQYPELLAGVDIGVIPFASRPFSLAKSNIAGLEYAAAGVPWIAARAHSEYRRLDPIAAAPRRQWSRLLELLADHERRQIWRERQAAALADSSIGSAGTPGTTAAGAAGRWELAIRWAL